VTFQTKIQALISTHTQNSGSGRQAAADWVNMANWQTGPSTGGVSGNFLVNMNMLTGAETGFENQTTYSAATEFPAAIDANGVYIAQGTLNIVQINPSTFAEIQNFNTGLSVDLGSIAPITATNGSHWLLIAGEPGATEVFTCINTDTNPMTSWSLGTVAYSNTGADACAGLPNTGIGYLMSGGTSIKLFKISVNISPSESLLATHAATDFDTGWSTATNKGICLDQTDGNVLAFVAGNTSPVSYMIKFNATTGAIIWKVSIPTTNAIGGFNINQSLIKSQQFVILGNPLGVTTAYIINTGTGTITSSFTTGLSGVLIFGSQAYNDQIGANVGEWSASTGGANEPVALNSTPSSFNGWGLLYLVQPSNPPPASGTHASYIRVWGHMTS